MQRSIKRELFWLSAPILALGTLPWLWGYVRGRYTDLPPTNLNIGAPRREVGHWVPETPTVVDFARGLSSRWTVTTWGGGACPAIGSHAFNWGSEYPSHLKLSYRRGAHWFDLPIPYRQSELDFTAFGTKNPKQEELHLGLPLDLVPKDAVEVRLRGYLEGYMICSSRAGGSDDVPTKSKPLDLIIKVPNVPWPQYHDSRVSLLKYEGVEIRRYDFPVGANNPRQEHLLEVRASFSYGGEDDKNTRKNIRKARSWLEDEKGRYAGEAGDAGEWLIEQGQGKAEWQAERKLLKNRHLFLRSWVYVDENEWPLLVKIPLFSTGNSAAPIHTYSSNHTDRTK